MNPIFENNISLLEKVIGKNQVTEQINRLKYIFENTENCWSKNLDRFENQKIKYLLICEAPPYSETEIPIYFYNQFDLNFNKIVWKTFFPNKKFPKNSEEYYQKLADAGFLLVDNLPFPIQYTSAQRKKSAYKKLLLNSFEWFLQHLKQEKLKISKDVKIAFGFKLNAIQFIELTEGKLLLTEKREVLYNRDNICANDAGYPDSNKLSKIYFDEFSLYKYYNGEEENPYLQQGESPLDFENPKSLFWHYERLYHSQSKNIYRDFHHFLDNLINGKLSEYFRDEKKVWEIYLNNSIK